MGRDFLVHSAITGSSDISLTGTKAAQSRYLIIDKTDSLVLFRDPKYNIRLNEEDDNQKEAFGLSRSNAIYKTLSVIRFIRVLLPAPFFPTSPVICPGRTSNEQSRENVL
jgi:hypothetical protein